MPKLLSALTSSTTRMANRIAEETIIGSSPKGTLRL
jgi:hypothetical protein